MEQTENRNYIEVVGRPSWVAYIRMMIRWVIAMVVLGFICLFIPNQFLKTAISWIGMIGCFAYQILYVRSINLFVDDKGVWYFRGVFPWQKGVSGVLWRDLDGAVF